MGSAALAAAPVPYPHRHWLLVALTVGTLNSKQLRRVMSPERSPPKVLTAANSENAIFVQRLKHYCSKKDMKEATLFIGMPSCFLFHLNLNLMLSKKKKYGRCLSTELSGVDQGRNLTLEKSEINIDT